MQLNIQIKEKLQEQKKEFEFKISDQEELII